MFSFRKGKVLSHLSFLSDSSTLGCRGAGCIGWNEFIHGLATPNSGGSISGQIGWPLSEGSTLNHFEVSGDVIAGAICLVSGAARNQGRVIESKGLFDFFDRFLMDFDEFFNLFDDFLVEFLVGKWIKFKGIRGYVIHERGIMCD